MSFWLHHAPKRAMLLVQGTVVWTDNVTYVYLLRAIKVYYWSVVYFSLILSMVYYTLSFIAGLWSTFSSLVIAGLWSPVFYCWSVVYFLRSSYRWSVVMERT